MNNRVWARGGGDAETRRRGDAATTAMWVAVMPCAADGDVKVERPQGINSREWRLRQLDGQADYSNDLVRRGERSRGNLFMPFTQRRRI